MENTKKLAKSTLAIIVFSLVGKLMGFVRESLQAGVFGATNEMDAFIAAQSATAIVSALVTTAIATTFIPALTKAENELGENQRNYFTNNLLTLATIFSIVVAILGYLFAPQLAVLFTTKTKPEVYLLVIKLIRLGIPVVVFSAVVGVFTGFLQYNNRFAAAGAINIPLNLCYIFFLLFMTNMGGIYGLTIVSVIGVLAQIIFLLPDSIRQGYRPKPVLNLKDKYVMEALALAVPVLMSSAVNDINVIVNRKLAANMVEGSVSILNYANKMNLMILGIFIAAITSIIFPTMSRAFSSDNKIQGKRVMNASVKLVLFLTIPATVGMIVLARPIVDVAFLHGVFTKQNAIDTTATLRFYTLALISMSVSMVLNRVYYSIADTKTPFVVGLINVVINVVLNLLVAHRFGTRGLAASVSIATTVAVLISFILLRRKIGNLGTKSYIRALIKTTLSATLMGLFALIYFPIESILINPNMSNATSTIVKLVILLIVVAIAALIYGISMYALGVREIRDVVNIIKKKLKKSEI
ncbi:murein biosynthesis integral membrane protein MurJ [Peptoniphilus indolicus]|uniref:Probable lipid II flippase MurJ n=2 Tax=Peptoniphilus indolicus TaxID=33030 RepID=G4D673_9FIRM|nr:murein biosynthesis integral membrane protein MurJ [Peptoniphilus indolicus]EGY77361.1 integral membrane protein MviN [Peptoniphilus indolicus ATCC 29427]SUB74498.1 integral membrane protein MviN [Peptoniphilus indolicus]